MRRANGFRRFRLAAGADRLRTNAWPVLQTALAASVAYFLAAIVLGQEQPFFAPIAAVISLGLTLGQRGRRTVELVFGVAIGLLVADLLVLAIGVGAVQVAVVVALAMAAALLFAERTLFVNQAAISAILVMVLQPPDSGLSPDRFLNALMG
ncbi:MAG: FUSC family protein [Actinomycetota bacterium]|nr:FUSC family protein [Actinomycetota bacterium]